MFNFLLFIALYLPFQLALNPTAGVDLASVRVLILGAFLWWLAESLRQKKISLSSGWQAGLVASFLFLNVFSIAVARNPNWSLRKLLFLFSIFPIYFVASAVIQNKIQAQKITRVLLWSGTAIALIGIGQFLAQFMFSLERVYQFWAKFVIGPFLGQTFSQAVLQNPSWLVNISGQTYLRATATFPDPHMLSFFLGLLIPLALVRLLQSPQKVWPSFSLVVLVLGDILTFSRGGYLGLAAVGLVAALFFWRKIGRQYKLGLAVAGVGLVLLLLIPSPVSTRFASIFNLKEGSNIGRIAIWQQAEQIIFEHPLLGVGIGNYPLAVNPLATYRDPFYAHNTYLDIAVETGLLNALIWMSLLGGTIIILWKKAAGDLFFLGAALSLVIFATHSLVETAIYSPVVLTLFLLILSFGALKNSDAKNS